MLGRIEPPCRWLFSYNRTPSLTKLGVWTVISNLSQKNCDIYCGEDDAETLSWLLQWRPNLSLSYKAEFVYRAVFQTVPCCFSPPEQMCTSRVRAVSQPFGSFSPAQWLVLIMLPSVREENRTGQVEMQFSSRYAGVIPLPLFFYCHFHFPCFVCSRACSLRKGCVRIDDRHLSVAFPLQSSVLLINWSACLYTVYCHQAFFWVRKIIL